MFSDHVIFDKIKGKKSIETPYRTG